MASSAPATSAHGETIPYLVERIASAANTTGKIATAISSTGAVGTVFETPGSNASFRYQAPGKTAVTIPLDVLHKEGNADNIIDFQIAASTGDIFYIVTQAASRDGMTADARIAIEEQLLIFDGSTLRRTISTDSRDSASIIPVPISLTADELGTHFIRVPVRPTPNPAAATSYFFPPTGNSSFSPAFNPATGYENVVTANSGRMLAFAGIDGTRLRARHQNILEAGTYTIAEDPDLPTDYAIATDGTRTFVAHITGGDIRLTTGTLPVASQAVLPSITLLAGISDAALTLDYSATTGLHLTYIPRTGADAGTLFHLTYEEAPTSSGTLADSEQTISTNANARSSVAIGPFGYAQFARAISNDYILTRTPIVEDADADGLPLFQELALCRDPSTPDDFDLIQFTSSTPPSGLGRNTFLTFERPPLPATASRGTITCGDFTYRVDTSYDLQSWFPPVNGFTFTTTPFNESATPTGFGTNGGFLQPVQTSQIGTSVPAIFQRLRIGIR